MKTNTTLFLTVKESAAFAALPDALREGWMVEKEEGTAYEDMDVLKVRAGMARFETFPALREYVKGIASGGVIEPTTIKDLPESVLPELFFTIGARGVSALIAALLASCDDDGDVAGVAGLSHIRRDILNTNASITLA